MLADSLRFQKPTNAKPETVIGYLKMQIRKKIFTIALLTIFYSLVIGFITISSYAKDEGALGENVVLNFFADYLYFLSVPTIILFSALAKTGLNNIQYFTLGVLLSSFIYAILTILIISYLKNNQVVNDSHYDKSNEKKL